MSLNYFKSIFTGFLYTKVVLIVIFFSMTNAYCKPNKEHFEKLITFVPGSQIYQHINVKESLDGLEYESNIKDIIQKVPEDILIDYYFPNLNIFWNPPMSLSGNSYPLGLYKLEVATLKLMDVKIEKDLITITDECFLYKGNENGKFVFELIDINDHDFNKLKNTRFYKVISHIDEKNMFNKIRWRRLSCFFTADKGIFSSILDNTKVKYKLDFPNTKDPYSQLTLFTRATFNKRLHSPLPDKDVEKWAEVGKDGIINHENRIGRQENLFFIGTYTSFKK